MEEEIDVERSQEDFPARNVHWRKANCERMVKLAPAEEILSEVLKIQIKAPIELLEEENDVESSQEVFPAKNFQWRKANREKMVRLARAEESSARCSSE